MRKYFPSLRNSNICYFDSAASTQKPSIVLDSMNHIYSTYYSNIHRGLYPWALKITESYEQAREKIQKFLGAKKSSEIIFTRSATEAINLVAYSYARSFLKDGDHILLSYLEHHANIVPWQCLAKEKNLIIDVSEITQEGNVDWVDFTQKLTLDTKLVALTHISNVFGSKLDIKKATMLAHQYGAKILIDGAQGSVHESVNVQDLDVDFYVITGHKLYGPTGIGALYIRSDIAENMPPFLTGGDMIEHVSFQETTFAKPPARFEAGTPPIVEAIGLGVAIDFILDIGWDVIIEHEKKVRTSLVSALQTIPNIDFLILIKNNAAPIISFIIDGVNSTDIAYLLGEQNVCVRAGHHCAEPLMQYLGITGTVRASLGIYNHLEEIDIFMHALNRSLKILK